MKKTVSSEPLVIVADKSKINNKIIFIWYKILNYFHDCLYYYYTPFFVTGASFIKLFFYREIFKYIGGK